jgi:hippurate hydrolase
MRIGQDARGGAFLHNSRYDFNDEILPLGAALHAGLIEQGMPLNAVDRPARSVAASVAS